MTKNKILKKPLPKKLSKIDSILETAGWFSLITLAIIVVFTYFRSPDVIPVHYNVVGRADKYGSKIIVFAILGIATFIFLSITALIKYVFNAPQGINPPNPNLDFALRIVRFLKLIVMLGFNYILVVTNLIVDGITNGLGSLFLPLVMVSLLFPIAFFFKRTMSPRRKR